MENIIFTYDRDLSLKNAQFTVTLVPASFRGGQWVISKHPRIFFVKDLEAIAARMPDKTVLRTALESEMSFRKNEGRFFSHNQEFTRLRIDSRHLFTFITACRKHRLLARTDGSVASFRVDRDAVPEIGVKDRRIVIYLGNTALSDADYVVKTMPVTVIRGDRIIQVRKDIPYSYLTSIPTDEIPSDDERNRILIDLSGQPGRLRIRSTGEKKAVRPARDLPVRPVLRFDERAVKARLYFSYNDVTVKDNDEVRVICDVGRNLDIHRNTFEETRFRESLLALGFSPRPEKDFNWRVPDAPLEQLAAALENQGFTVNVGQRKLAGKVEVRWDVRSVANTIRVGGTVVSGDLELGMDGLFQCGREGRNWVERSDGSLGIISVELQRILSDLSRSGHAGQGSVTFNKADYVRVRACLDGEAVTSDPAYEALCRFRGGVDGVRPYPVPSSFEQVLRPYQVLGYRWLKTLKGLDLNGILADDMGLGKTIQILALIQSLKDSGDWPGPVLLIAPRTLLFNWELEIGKFAPGLVTCVFSGPSRIRNPEFLEKHDIVLTSYGLMRTEIPLLCSVSWGYMILDEAHAVKNPETLTAKAVRHIPAAFRLAVTGTPVENSAADLWSLFDVLMPGFLGDLASFKETYGDTSRNLPELREKTTPFILRRLKSQVLAELPPKTEVTVFCEFSDDQKAVYEQAVAEARQEMEHLEGSKAFHILRLILRLRQIACHPALAIRHSLRPLSSGKTEDVFHAALEILSEGHKILVFSQFTRHLRLMETQFAREKITGYYLDGQTPDRAAVIQAFKTHDGPCLFFISLKTGGTGLNLSEASYVFLLDPWWNPAVENQAIDRSHRMGQQQPVTVYRFITRGSIEEKVNELKSLKQDIESAVITATAPKAVPFDESTLKNLIA